MDTAHPIRVGTRGSPLALYQARHFIDILTAHHPGTECAEHIIRTTGDAEQTRRLAEIGGKGLFAKEIHEAMLDHRIDFAVHSLKDLETTLPDGIILACTLKREDARDALILGPDAGTPDPADPLACLPAHGIIGTSSVRRQSQLLHQRPDLKIALLRGNVQTRLERTERGDFAASLLAMAGLKRLGFADRASLVLDPETMVPSACQGIVGVTIRADDTHLLELLAAIEDPEARAVATAERTMLALLDGSCRTPIGGYARFLPEGTLHLTGLVAREDGSFLLKRSAAAPPADAARLGADLGAELRADCPEDLFL
jgi:hydroxymethylbilane synthase